MITLRYYQTDAINNLIAGLKQGHKRQVLKIPTGGGKTAIAAEITKRAVDKGNIVWFTVDNLELVDQAFDAFTSIGLDVSIIQGINELTDYTKSVQILTNQTLARRWNVFDRNPHWLPDVIFHDECHAVFKAHKQIQMMMPDIPVIGLSATPYAKGLGKLYSNLVVGHTTQQLIDEGYLCDFEAYAPFTPDMKGVALQNGDYNPKESVLKVNQRKIVGNVVVEWKKHASDRKTIAFACNIAHSEAICKEFVESGVNAIHLDGYTDKDERKEIIARFKRGEIDVLCSVMVLTKGFDAPIASCAIMAAPTKSIMKYVQQVGRVLRIFKGKEKALILDHAGNIERLGFPTDDFMDYLDDGEKKDQELKKQEKKEKLPTPCPSCKLLTVEFPCPSCGFIPQRTSDVIHEEGTLKKLERKKRIAKDIRQKWYSMLLCHAGSKGFSEGWAAHAYKSKFKEWPNDLNRGLVQPDKEIKGYITYMNIRRAKSNHA